MVESQTLVSASASTVGGSGSSLIKQLASCNKPTRDKSLRLLLNKWLPSQHEISNEDMKKIWKGLFYCVWHADKTLVQSELIDLLSSLLLSLPLPLSTHYFSVFLLTIRREWPGIDSLRLDKFYLLIRRFICCFFLLLKNKNWDLELTTSLMGILEERAFLADQDKFLGNGVNYHIGSVFLEELKPFLPVSAETLDVIFKPLLSVMCKSKDRVLVGKIKANVFDVLLKFGKSLLERKKLAGGDDAENEIVNLGTIALLKGFSAKFYDLGSSPDCYQGNRKVLYGLHEEFMKLEKDLELSGIEISFPVVRVDGGGEVPKLVPIVASEMVPKAGLMALGSCTTKSKKKKKAKKGSDRIKENGISLKNENEKENENENVKGITASGENGESSIDEPTSDGSVLTFNKSVISNLQMQFEKVAAEIGLENGGTDSMDTPEIANEGTISKKKRKRARSMGRDLDNSGQVDAAKSTDKSAKKVRFSIKNNLVWKPQSPLPPQSLRLPPSVTPRGSALKKGIPPGPIREMPPANKMLKKKKKGRRGIKTISPGIKRLWKLQTLSL
ncbi:hypothetical protein LguiB_020773 [Lonicera macranthoides]